MIRVVHKLDEKRVKVVFYYPKKRDVFKICHGYFKRDEVKEAKQQHKLAQENGYV